MVAVIELKNFLVVVLSQQPLEAEAAAVSSVGVSPSEDQKTRSLSQELGGSPPSGEDQVACMRGGR